LTLPLEHFDPAALIRRVKGRRPLGEVAAQFGIDALYLSRAIANLRRDDPDYPVRRRKLRGVVYVEPAAPSAACRLTRAATRRRTAESARPG
jgi:hypothetical protein